jgi:hypothetical protein
MTDLYLGIVCMTGLGAVFFAATRRFAGHAPKWLYDLLALITVAVLLIYIRWFWDDVRLARFLPVPNLIIVGSWFLPLIGVLAGLVWGRIRNSQARCWFSTGLLFAVALYATVQPVLGQAPTCRNQWEGEICLQTTRSTCAAAAAATLLRQFQIPAREQEMADLCLTRQGTTWKGIYRGLKLKTAETPWEVEVFRASLDELRNGLQGPAILEVELKSDAFADIRYQTEWGWIPGTPHSVVFLGVTEQGGFLVADPSVGREEWSREDLALLWTGEGIRLVPRAAGLPDHAPLILAASHKTTE